MVAAYMAINDATVPTGAPAPDVERAFQLSSGKRFHTTTDLVWGYTQAMLTSRASRLLACVSRSGITYPVRAPFGPRNIPSIFQDRNQSQFGTLTDPEGDDPQPFVVVAIDDVVVDGVDAARAVVEFREFSRRAFARRRVGVRTGS